MGTGAVGFLLAQRYPDVPIWFNEANPLIYDYWRAVRDDLSLPDRLEELKKQLYSPVQKRRAFMDARRRIRDGTNDGLDFILVNAYAVSAIVSRDRGDIASFSSTWIKDGLKQVTGERLSLWGDILRRKNVKLTLGDYRAVLAEPGRDVWIYLDPPYLVAHNGSPLYGVSWDKSDHEELARLCNKSTHRILMSNGPAKFILDLYPQDKWHHGIRRYTGSMPHRPLDPWKCELELSNYDL